MTPETLELMISSFITLFVIIDPIGTAPLFGSLTADYSKQHRLNMATKGTLVGGGVLLFFAVLGDMFLAAFGISMDAFRTAGGLLLVLTAIEMVFELRTKRRAKRMDRVEQRRDDEHAEDISVFPLGVPLIAGPGSITTIMLLMSNATGHEDEQAIVIGSMVAVMLVTFTLMLGGAWILSKFGQSMTKVVTRVMGIILAALGVQYIFDGIKGAF